VSPANKSRVVFDTNAVLSALLFTHGRLSWLVAHWQSAACIPIVSHATAEELMRTLAYPKFKLSAEQQLEVLAGYIPFCEAVEITKLCPILCRDANDQTFLNLAHCAKAAVLVTGDDDLLALVGQTAFVIETPEAYRLRITSTAPHS
jgi:putative PIN family toxin of toxin-antitoxin system